MVITRSVNNTRDVYQFEQEVATYLNNILKYPHHIHDETDNELDLSMVPEIF